MFKSQRENRTFLSIDEQRVEDKKNLILKETYFRFYEWMNSGRKIIQEVK